MESKLFFKVDENLRGFLHLYWDKHLEGKAWQVKEEFIQFQEFILKNRIEKVLEIGTHKGGSALGMLSLGCEVISLDVVKHPEVDAIEKDYPESFKFYDRNNLPAFEGPVDLLWIDGDHSWDAVLWDFQQFNGLVKPGGYIAFHDVLDNELHEKQKCEVAIAIRTIITNYEAVSYSPSRIDIIDPNAGWGGITILKVPSNT